MRWILGCEVENGRLACRNRTIPIGLAFAAAHCDDPEDDPEAKSAAGARLVEGTIMRAHIEALKLNRQDGAGQKPAQSK